MRTFPILIVGVIAISVLIYVAALLIRELVQFALHGARPQPAKLATLILHDDVVKLIFDSARNYTLSALLEWAGLFVLWKATPELAAAPDLFYGVVLAFGTTLFLSGYLLVFLNVAYVFRKLLSLGVTIKIAFLFASATFLVGVCMLSMVVVLRLFGFGA